MTSHKPRILVIEDEPDIREGFTGILEAHGFSCQGAGSLREGRAALESFQPELLLLDLGLPDGHGLDLIREIRKAGSHLPILVITAETTVATAVQAMKEGARDYLEKPIGMDRLLTTVRLAFEEKGLREQNQNLLHQAAEQHAILGKSPAIVRLRSEIARLADTELPILVTGEHGTGKELVARGLHLGSRRFGQPFVAANCAAVPETLMEAEYFGHEKGAFTGADRERAGLFIEAGEGTLFLDEIGEMPLTLQARLLRVLQEREVRALGSSENRPLRCRIVAATNKDLEEEIAAGNFREDLYYRIKGLELNVPPLRERQEDIGLLARHFLEEADVRAEDRLAPDSLTWLAAQPWPGNVRQLASLMRAAAVLLEPGELDPDELAPLLGPQQAMSEASNGADPFLAMESLKEFRDSVEREFLRRKLEEEGWNVSATARRIGIRRTNLHERLKHHGLK